MSRKPHESDDRLAGEPTTMVSTFIFSLRKYVYTKNEGKSEDDDGSERFLESHLSSTRVGDERLGMMLSKARSAATFSLLLNIWPPRYFSGKVATCVDVTRTLNRLVSRLSLLRRVDLY